MPDIVRFHQPLLQATLIEMMTSKIHRVKVTEANLNYIGSITIDMDLP